MAYKRLGQFRSDLEIIPRIVEGGAFRYLIKVQQSEETYEFGEEEYFLCQQLDGETSFPQIQRAFQDRYGTTLPLLQLEAFGRRLESAHLLVQSMDIPGDLSLEMPGRCVSSHSFNGFLNLLAACLGWCFSLPFSILLCIVAFLATGVIVTDLDDYYYTLYLLKELFGASIFFLVWFIGYFLISLLSEVAKGVACRHFGGQPTGLKLVFVYRIIPRLYVDLYDSLWFMNRSERIQTLLAGPVSQFMVWVVGVIGWKRAIPGTDLHTFWSLFTLSTFVYFLLNVNPLLQRDGYLLFAAWKEIWNLDGRAEAVARAWIFRRPLPEPLSTKEIRLFRWYGLLSIGLQNLLEIFFFGILGYFLMENLKGVGAVIFLTVLFLRFEDFLRDIWQRVFYPTRWLPSESGAIRFSWVWKCAFLLCIVALMFVPYPYETGGAFKLLPVSEIGIRAKVPGEIESVFVEEGQWVQEGQNLAKLTGREQQKKVEELEAAIDKSRANLELLKKGAKPEEIEKAKQDVKAAATSYSYSRSQADRSEKMFREKAIPEKDYENALRVRDVDRERLESAKKNLELVESGFRDDQVKAVEAEIRGYEVELKHARENLEQITFVSPIEGRVITPGLSETIGQYIYTGELFAVVEDARTMVAEVLLPEEELGEIKDGAHVKLRAWAYPTTVFQGCVKQIAPVAFEQSRGKLERAYSEREWLIEQNQTIREKGRVVRVLCEMDNSDKLLKTDMTGYAKIESSWRPFGVAFTQWLMRFLFVEVWSWIP